MFTTSVKTAQNRASCGLVSDFAIFGWVEWLNIPPFYVIIRVLKLFTFYLTNSDIAAFGRNMQSRTSILAQKVRCKKFKQPVRGCYFYVAIKHRRSQLNFKGKENG